VIFWEPDIKANTARTEAEDGTIITVRGGHSARPPDGGEGPMVCHCGERMVRIKAGTLWHLNGVST